MYVLKFDAAGALEWEATYGPSDGFRLPGSDWLDLPDWAGEDICITSDGDFVVAVGGARVARWGRGPWDTYGGFGFLKLNNMAIERGPPPPPPPPTFVSCIVTGRRKKRQCNAKDYEGRRSLGLPPGRPSCVFQKKGKQCLPTPANGGKCTDYRKKKTCARAGAPCSWTGSRKAGSCGS